MWTQQRANGLDTRSSKDLELGRQCNFPSLQFKRYAHGGLREESSSLKFKLTHISQVLPDKDISSGIAAVLMLQYLGGSIFVSAANNLFNTRLVRVMTHLNIPGLDVSQVISGATALRSLVPKEYLPQVLEAYMLALRDALRVALILACLSILGVFGMEWRRIKGHESEKKGEKTNTRVPTI